MIETRTPAEIDRRHMGKIPDLQGMAMSPERASKIASWSPAQIARIQNDMQFFFGISPERVIAEIAIAKLLGA